MSSKHRRESILFLQKAPISRVSLFSSKIAKKNEFFREREKPVNLFEEQSTKLLKMSAESDERILSPLGVLLIRL